MTRPEIGGPSPTITTFADAIRATLGPHINEDFHASSGSYQWSWTNRGVWTLTVGGQLEPEPRLEGPAGNRWRMDMSALAAADLVLVLLRLAGGMPPGMDVAPPPARGGVYGRSPGPRHSVPEPVFTPSPAPGDGRLVELHQVASGPGPYLKVSTPSGGTAMIDRRRENTIVEPLSNGALGVLVVPVVPTDADHDAVICARLYEADQAAPRQSAPPVIGDPVVADPQLAVAAGMPAPPSYQPPARSRPPFGE